MKKLILFLICAIVLAGCGPAPEDPRLTEIAKCLTEKGAKMYGAVWCSHCTQQKESFGPSFQYIDYFECDPQTNLEQAKICVEKDIQTVPAWELPDGSWLQGKHDPEELAEILGC